MMARNPPLPPLGGAMGSRSFNGAAPMMARKRAPLVRDDLPDHRLLQWSRANDGAET